MFPPKRFFHQGLGGGTCPLFDGNFSSFLPFFFCFPTLEIISLLFKVFSHEKGHTLSPEGRKVLKPSPVFKKGVPPFAAQRLSDISCF